jgi:hypothetical protein
MVSTRLTGVSQIEKKDIEICKTFLGEAKKREKVIIYQDRNKR